MQIDCNSYRRQITMQKVVERQSEKKEIEMAKAKGKRQRKR